MRKSSAPAITSLSTTRDAVQPATVARLLDHSQFVLRKPALSEDTCKALARSWAVLLSSLGLVESQVEEAFNAALTAKDDTFPLSWPEVRAGALKVLQQPDAPKIQRLDEGDCDFFWGMIPVWQEQNTEQSRAYLAELHSYFEQYAATEPEYRVLKRLRQCAPAGESR